MFVYPNINPVALNLGKWQLPFATIEPKIHWYGIMYLCGFTLFYILGLKRSRRADSPMNATQLGDFLFYAAMGVIVGGRVGYALFYNLPLFLQNPLSVFKIWDGGMSFHGGLLGVTLVCLLYSKRVLHCSLWALGDFIAPLVPLGLFCGRIGNFINAELWGRETSADFVFAMLYDGKYRHPSMLYEAALEGVLLFTILWLFSRKPRPRCAVTGLFLVGYGAARFSVEFVRLPDVQLGYLAGGWFTMGHLLTLPMIGAGLALMSWAYWQSRKESKSCARI